MFENSVPVVSDAKPRPKSGLARLRGPAVPGWRKAPEPGGQRRRRWIVSRMV
ncbi:hypothetical protein CALCODRAFT_261501 [Calocera cornea HHB12733]|uniref:Uncharacterized protein n=1 Tax=Calocera cornea HHB12733 TaxID=1353952 RepID=A0A165GEC4_9BASI|nr:hypothetical protein CALCODRAFT_261501 [Calocera cornea HHB12733]